MSEAPSVNVRKYRPEDRRVVRHICCETGCMGKPVEALFEDRELFADYLTRYYTDEEPESSFVLEKDGEVRGYLLGSRYPERQERFDFWNNIRLGVRGSWRYLTRYRSHSKRFVKWVLSEGRRQTPFTPGEMPHFHINFLEDCRHPNYARQVIDSYLTYLVECGEKQVFGQMVVFEKRRGERMFARYGFRVVDRREVTKFRHLSDQQVFLFTVVKDLEDNPRLYGKDLWKEQGHAEAK